MIRSNVRSGGFFGLGLLLGATLAFIGAYSVENLNSPKVNTSAEAMPEVSEASELTPEKIGATGNGSLPKARQIEHLLQSTNRFDRPVALHNFLSEIDSGELGELLNEAASFSSDTFKSEVQVAIARTLASNDPAQTLIQMGDIEGNVSQSMIAAVFEEWFKLDRDEAVETASTLADSQRSAALEGMLNSGTSLSQHELIEIGGDLGNTEEVVVQIANKVIKEKILDPESLWSLLIESYGNKVASLSGAQQQLYAHVAASFVDQQGSEGIRTILSTLPDVDSRVQVLGVVFQEFADTDPEAAFRLATQSDNLDQETVELIIQEWAESNPLTALAAALEMGVLKGRMSRLVVKAWAATDPESLYEMLDTVPELSRSWARNQAVYAMAKTAPDSALLALEDIDDQEFKLNVSTYLANSWPEKDLASALDWSKSNRKIAPEMRSEIQRILVERLARIDPMQALNLARKEEAAGSTSGLEAAVIMIVSESNIDDAIEMLKGSNHQATREQAYPAIGMALVRKGRYGQARELVEDIPIEMQRDYYLAITVPWAEYDFENLLNSLDSLPDDPAVRQFAYMALASTRSQYRVPITEEQKQDLMSNLPEIFRPLFE